MKCDTCLDNSTCTEYATDSFFCEECEGTQPLDMWMVVVDNERLEHERIYYFYDYESARAKYEALDSDGFSIIVYLTKVLEMK